MGELAETERCWELGQRWYAGRLDRDWDRAGPEEAEAVFRDVGLTGPFWSLTGRTAG